jgi:hypothetical protein
MSYIGFYSDPDSKTEFKLSNIGYAFDRDTFVRFWSWVSKSSDNLNFLHAGRRYHFVTDSPDIHNRASIEPGFIVHYEIFHHGKPLLLVEDLDPADFLIKCCKGRVQVFDYESGELLDDYKPKGD